MKNESFVALGDIAEIEQYVYQDEDIFFWNPEKRKDIQNRLIKDSFEYHYRENRRYRNYCDLNGVNPSTLEDILEIPLLPSTVFKSQNILSVRADDIVKKCTSSGTEGNTSLVNRDEVTLNRFLGSVEEALDQMFGLDDAILLNLGPSTDEAKDLWFSYVMSITDMIFPALNFVQNDVFYPDRLIDAMYRYKSKYETLVLTGAPIMYLRLMEYMKAKDVKIEFGDKVFIITAGGWKKYSGEAIARPEFETMLRNFFVNLSDLNIRDVLNMVELNTICPECENKVKHIPPWVHISVRSPHDLKPMERGQTGLLAYMDPTTVSYPAFILATDFGRVAYEDDCPCGRTGTAIEIIRRVNRGQARGCALKMDKLYTVRG